MLYRGVQLESKEMASLGDVLMATIKKVQDDKTYVEQAVAINDTAKTVIDLKRAQIELIRLMKSRRSQISERSIVRPVGEEQ